MAQSANEQFGHAQPDTLGTPTTDESETMAERARRQVEAGRESVQQAGQKVGQTAATATEQCNAFVRENPGLSLAGALGVGVLIGLAIRDRY